MRILELSGETRKDILSSLLKRSPNNYGQYEEAVGEIVSHVKAEGDKALFAYTKKFDKFDLNAQNIRVTRAEIDEAYKSLDADLIEVMKRSAENIRAFHTRQLRNSWFDAKEDGTILGMRMTPIEKAGVYVPGGKAAYPSSVLKCNSCKSGRSKRNHYDYAS